MKRFISQMFSVAVVVSLALVWFNSIEFPPIA
jgi:hypothetical protein